MAIKCLDARQEFAVVSDRDEDLLVVAHGVEEDALYFL